MLLYSLVSLVCLSFFENLPCYYNIEQLTDDDHRYLQHTHTPYFYYRGRPQSRSTAVVAGSRPMTSVKIVIGYYVIYIAYLVVHCVGLVMPTGLMSAVWRIWL